MVKLIVIARCVPEDVYLHSLESPTPVKKHPDEKKFLVVVREPEEWYIGRLAIEIKTRYLRHYGSPLGEIKYLKDEDDCDLDPELSVADLLVDEGTAARDGADQKKIVKVIQERGRAIRQGSVIPDLTPTHYQPPTRPPIPRFPDVLEKRRTEERQTDDRPTKRRRLDQIEEETNNIVNSIERDALNGSLNDNAPEVEFKQESPELARTWINTGPATADELELLPEAPARFNPRSKKDKQSTGRRQDLGPEIRESSAIPQDDQQDRRTTSSNRGPDSIVDRFVRQQSAPNEQTPATPQNGGTNIQTPGGQVVSMLNSMKSNSPLRRQSASVSANKFRKPVKNVYDYPESDIDDTQMSPRSKASRSRITPKLVQTPFSRSTPKSNDTNHRRNSQQSTAVQESPTQRNRDHEDAMDVDGDKENQLPHPQDQQELPLHAKSNDENEAADAGQVREVISHQTRQLTQSFNTDKSSVLGSDETWSVQEDGTKKKQKKPRQSRAQRKSTGDVSTPQGSSAASAKATPNAGDSTQPKLKRKRTASTRVSEVHSRSEISELDSPGMQLSETLRQSSPVARQSKDSSQNVSEVAARSTHASDLERTAEQVKDVEMDNVERPPDSVSGYEEDMPLIKAPERTKTKSTASKSTKTEMLKCLSCWTRSRQCDNAEPKCNTCARDKKTCQIPKMTEAEASAEKARRKAEKSLKSNKNSGKKRSKPEPQPLEDIVSASDREDGSDDQPKPEAVKVAQSQDTTSRRKSNKTPSKPRAAEVQVSAGDDDDVSESESKSRAPESSQSTAAKSKTKKKPAGTPSKTSVPVQDIDTNLKNDNSLNDFKEVSAPAGHPQTQVESGPGSKKRIQANPSKHDSCVSPIVGRKQDIKDKGSESSRTFEVPASVERAAPVTPAIPKETQPALANKSTTRERSLESQVTSTGKILPPGMTEEEYESLIGSRANLTDEQRTEKKLQIRKMGKTKDSTPSLRHESSTQDLAERSKQDTSSIKSSQQAPPSSRSTSKNQSNRPPSTQSARAPASVKSSTPSAVPASAPAKSKADPPAANSSAKAKLKLQPAANTSAKTKSPNPPFQPHQSQPDSSAQRKSILPTSLTSKSTISPSLSASRSVAEMRMFLQASRSGSDANTPQPTHTTAAKIAEMRRNANATTTKKTMLSLSDDDDDESASDEEETDEEEDPKASSNKPASKPVNGNANGRGNVTVRRRTPSDSGSESESESESGSGSGDKDDSDEE